MAKEKTQTQAKKKQTQKQPPADAFTKAEVKEFITVILQSAIKSPEPWRKGAEIHNPVFSKFGIGIATVRRYLTELIKEGHIHKRFKVGDRTVQYAMISVPSEEKIPALKKKPVVKKKPADKPPTPVKKPPVINVTIKQKPGQQGADDFKAIANVIDEGKVIPGSDALKSVCEKCNCNTTGDHEIELMVDSNDTDLPGIVHILPEKSVRTINAPKFTRADCVLRALKLHQRLTPSELIVESDTMYVVGGGVSDIQRQTQVYKIIAKALFEVDAAEIDVMGMFVFKK